MVIGFGLCVAELVLPALILIWLGVAAFVLSLLMLVIPMSLTIQLLMWAFLSAAFTLLWLRVFKPESTDSRAGSSTEMIGEVGLLVRPVEPFVKGEILFQRPLLGSDRWICIADTHIPAGSRVQVLSIEGSAVKVTLA